MRKEKRRMYGVTNDINSFSLPRLFTCDERVVREVISCDDSLIFLKLNNIE